MILDSTFLVDFERESRKQINGPATRFIEEHQDETLMITFTIAGELAAGDSMANDRQRWENFISPFLLLQYSSDVAWHFGSIYRELKASGSLIGANDLWIAATARAYQVPLVTRNADDFARIKTITVHSY